MLEAVRNKLDCLCLGSRVPAANHVELTSVTFHYDIIPCSDM